MMITRKYAILILILLVLALSACVKDDLQKLNTNNWQPFIAIPLVNSKLTAGDFIKNFETGGYLTSDSGQNIIAVYENNYVSREAAELFPLENMNFVFVDSLVQMQLPMHHNEVIDELVLKDGNISYTLSSQEQEDIAVQLVL